MNVLNYGTFEQILYPYVKHRFQKDKGTTRLEDFTYEILSANAGSDGIEELENLSADLASKYRTGKRTIPDNIVKSFLGTSARKNIVEYMQDAIVGLVAYGRKGQLIKDFCILIENESDIDANLQEKLLDEAKPEYLAEFLADVLIYAITADPTKANKQLAKLSGPALTVLIDQAVPMVVKAALALNYADYGDNPEATTALKDNRFSDFIRIITRDRKMSGKEYYQWCNVLKISAKAQDELYSDMLGGKELEISSGYDIDWYMHFFDCAGSVSNEDMQRLWAKMLAGELKSPGHFSRKTLRTLLDMDPRIASCFERAAEIVVTDTDRATDVPFIFETNQLKSDINSKYNIFETDLRSLIDYGLVLPKMAAKICLRSTRKGGDLEAILTNSRESIALLFSQKDEGAWQIIPYEKYELTLAGQELLRIIGNPDDDYLALLGFMLSDEASGICKISAHSVVKQHFEFDGCEDYRIDAGNQMIRYYRYETDDHRYLDYDHDIMSSIIINQKLDEIEDRHFSVSFENL